MPEINLEHDSEFRIHDLCNRNLKSFLLSFLSFIIRTFVVSHSEVEILF